MNPNLVFMPGEIPPYAFCESVTGVGPWHIRRVNPETGLKLGGGIDTRPLCGGCKLGGWDLSVRITGAHLVEHYVCRQCVDAYREER